MLYHDFLKEKLTEFLDSEMVTNKEKKLNLVIYLVSKFLVTKTLEIFQLILQWFIVKILK